MDLLDVARADLADAEAQLGITPSDLPVHVTDQWTAGVRETFAALAVDLDDPDQAQAAYAGMYIAAAGLLNGGAIIPWCSATGIVRIWRHLADRIEADPE